jgi:hypothetical protein
VLISKSAGGTGTPAGPEGGHDPNNPEAFQAPSGGHKAQGGGAAGGGGSLLPERYVKAETTPLAAEVTAGGENTFEFDL